MYFNSNECLTNEWLVLTVTQNALATTYIKSEANTHESF